MQAPDHVIERTRALAKAGDDPKKRRKVQTKKPADGEVSWTEETFARLRDAVPEPLVSKMRVDHSMILNVVNQPADPVETMRALMEDNHEDERGRRRLSEHAQALGDELVGAGVLVWLTAPDPDGRTLQLAVELQADFALNQPLASFALVAFALLDPESDSYSLDVLSVVEAILDDPFPVLMAQAHKARGEAVAEMKAQGIEYDERMELLEEVSYPKPLGEPLLDALRAHSETHPWVRESDLSPKSVVRDMYERGLTFTEFVAFYGLARSEGLVLRYLSNAYRALRHTVPEEVKTDELDEIVEWLGETVRQTDSSLLDEWEALDGPGVGRPRGGGHGGGRGAAAAPADHRERPRVHRHGPQRHVPEGQARVARRRRGARAARGRGRRAHRPAGQGHDDRRRVGGRAGRLLGRVRRRWTTGPAARSPQLLMIDATRGRRSWTVRQIIDDPEDHHDFAIVATVDLDASDAAGEPVIRTTSFGPREA